MCDENKFFDFNVMCSYNLGGYCDIGNSSECICKQSFDHDLTQFRQRDCSLHKSVMPLICSWCLIASLITLIFSLNETLQATSMARLILLAVKLNCISNIFLCYYQRYNINYANDSMCGLIKYFCFSFGFAQTYLIIYHLASPLYKMTASPETTIYPILLVSNFIFRCLGLVLTLVAIIIYGDYLNPNNDRGWNIIVSLIFIFHGFETIVIQIFIQCFGRKATKQIEHQMKTSSNNTNHERTKLYIGKVRRLMKIMMIIFPIHVILWLVPSICILSFGYFPAYNFLVSVSYFQGVLFSALVVLHVRKERIISQQDSEVGNRSRTNLNSYPSSQITPSENSHQDQQSTSI